MDENTIIRRVAAKVPELLIEVGKTPGGRTYATLTWPDDYDGAHSVAPKGTPAPAGEPTNQ